MKLNGKRIKLWNDGDVNGRLVGGRINVLQEREREKKRRD